MNNPLNDNETGPVGEYPDVPARSGAAALFDAAAAVDRAADHTRNLQRAIDDVRTWCHGKDTVATVEITNIIRSHHV
ncbi:hypothetical protein [Mycolicibacterium fortuitum]|uniref:hypothetical protein n=1 Tax=Mycolicibacterium fortuitum TaxID=1766 RepID=UPI0026253088|nr:hypothetical protein [Mycolicibacterium fortuitum]